MSVSLNLSRKWRSQDFDHIVGQDLAVRILKNSLYLGHYFPVYLFAGQRGCGKTSTARIFAAAVNCQSLTLFQKDPKKSVVPCLVCDSCIAMRDGNHPDFVEIDAASHTGVDNIRSIIESSSLLPLMGRKRVYLIDEAHMLSKAAFNAALKILEEPPATALFILATTNPHKIIDTVRSRCFQLFFTAIPHDALKNHLQSICNNEKIVCDDKALDLIVRHAGGSARDALNLLEQVRFSASVINKDSILSLLGHIDDYHIMDLIRVTLQGSSGQLIHMLESFKIDDSKAEFIWQRMIFLLRGLLWVKHGVKPNGIIASIKLLEDAAKMYTIEDVHCMVDVLYKHEELFLKTTMKHILLEMILVDLCSAKKNNGGNDSAPCAVSTSIPVDEIHAENEESEDDKEEAVSDEQKWQQFVARIESLSEPLLNSVFKQARFIDMSVDTVFIELPKDFVLFADMLQKTRPLWQPVLRHSFSSSTVLDAQFTASHKSETIKKQKSDDGIASVKPLSVVQDKPQPKPVPSSSASSSTSFMTQRNFRSSSRYGGQSIKPLYNSNEPVVDVSDAHVWKKASILIGHFPGVVTEIRENQ